MANSQGVRPDDPDDLYVSPVKGHVVSLYGTATQTVLPPAPSTAKKPRVGSLAWFRGPQRAKPRISGKTHTQIGHTRGTGADRGFKIHDGVIVLVPGETVRRFAREYARALNVDKSLVRRTKKEYLAQLQTKATTAPAPSAKTTGTSGPHLSPKAEQIAEQLQAQIEADAATDESQASTS